MNTSKMIFHRAAIRRTIEARRSFSVMLGVTPSTDPREVVLAVKKCAALPALAWVRVPVRLFRRRSGLVRTRRRGG